MTCTRCGAAMPTDSPDQLCPRCLLAAALDSNSATAVHSPGSFAAPSVEELQKLFPSLEILGLLGKGGMGAVYKARQLTLDRLVAVKILPPSSGRDAAFAERFSREARALAKLSHANIVGVYDFGQVSGPVGPQFYFLMEYVDGVNIRQAMRAGTLSPTEALKIVPQICDALQFAHDEGIVHRDIKPENILLDKKGRVKIADFGLAKLLGPETADHSLTGTQQVMGTLHYMAPEQVEGAKQVDHRADIYSLGVTFYEMLTGELPLGRFQPPSARAAVDVRLDQIVLKTLEKAPGDRYQHVSQVKTDVELVGGPTPNIGLFGREYKSKTTLFGLPLLHMAFGYDAQGKRRIAKGIVAIGDIAIGVFAIGGTAMGGVCFGGVTLGLLSLGGIAVGLLAAVGGLALGGIAFGGLAVGVVSLGGLSVGYYALGGGGAARFGLFGDRQDPEAIAFFEGWGMRWLQWLTIIAIATPIAGLLLAGFIWTVFTLSANTRPGLTRYMKWAGLPTLALWALTVLLVVVARFSAPAEFDPRGDAPAMAMQPMWMTAIPVTLFGVLIPLYLHYLWAIFGQGIADTATARTRHASNWMIGMCVACLAYVGLTLAWFVYLFTDSPPREAPGIAALGIGVVGFGAATGILLLHGGVCLGRLEHRLTTRLANVLAILPLTYLWPFTLPVGILGLMTLSRRDVLAALNHASPISGQSPGTTVDSWKVGRWILPAAFVLVALFGATTLFMQWSTFRGNGSVRGGDLQITGNLFQLDTYGTRTWQAAVVAGLFFGIACLRLATSNLGARLAVTIVTLGLAIASVTVASIYIARPPVPTNSPYLRLAVQNLKAVAPNLAIDPASDGGTLIEASRTLNFVVTHEAVYGAYLALLAGAGLILLSVLEISRFAGRNARVPAP